MRKLASIQRVADIQPIDGADRIEVATINGWKVVVGKGQFGVGDLCVYFEIDSVLPIEHFPDLEKTKGRIKTIRLRGQLSQGYCIPLERFWDIVDETSPGFNQDVGMGIHTLRDGSDVTYELKVEKYEPPITFQTGETKGVFPTHILPKSDEDRIQSNLIYLDKMAGLPWVATVKYDGTSATFGYDEGEFFACSRNLSIRDGDNVYWNISRKYNITEIPEEFVIQGEICGPGIQKNHLGLSEIDFFVFRIYNQLEKRYLLYDERVKLTNKWGLKHVEYVPINEDSDHFCMTIESLLDLAKGKYKGTKNDREGVVIEANEHVGTEFGGHLSFKIINNDFLLKGGD